ncbi:MAG: lactonase family protein [Bacteroidota bacterium]|nr:lactonase family protein [Bacteroidota bacterium]
MRILLAICLSCSLLIVSAQNYYLFVGTYTGGKSKGIYVFQFNAKNGEVQWVSNTDSANNPSFLTIAPDGKHLYAVNEIETDHSGKVSAYSFDPGNGTLHLLNQVASGSENPCHVSITKDGKWVAVANYSGGSLAMFPVNTDGTLNPFAQHIIHKGKSINPARQEKAHVHSVFFSPDEHYLYTPDLGMDKVTVYRFDPKSRKPLSPAPVPYISTTPGAGPRHISFSPDKKFLYLIEEMGGSVDVYQYANGNTRFVQRIATHPENYTGLPGSADIHLSPDGKFLYASNRGDENNLAIFSVDRQSGKLTHVGYQRCGGLQPRNFIIDPTGNFLLVANQKTNNIVVYRRDRETGLLQATLQQIEVPSPVCLQMLAK